jgi:hypothetical protein
MTLPLRRVTASTDDPGLTNCSSPRVTARSAPTCSYSVIPLLVRIDGPFVCQLDQAFVLVPVAHVEPKFELSSQLDVGVAQQPRQRILPDQERQISKILAVILDQVEGVEDCGPCRLTTGQLLEP